MPENYNLDPNTSSDFSKKEGEGIPNIQSNIETPQSIPQPGIPQPIPQTEIDTNNEVVISQNETY